MSVSRGESVKHIVYLPGILFVSLRRVFFCTDPGLHACLRRAHEGKNHRDNIYRLPSRETKLNP